VVDASFPAIIPGKPPYMCVFFNVQQTLMGSVACTWTISESESPQGHGGKYNHPCRLFDPMYYMNMAAQHTAEPPEACIRSDILGQKLHWNAPPSVCPAASSM
jgi:hypothetical protein